MNTTNQRNFILPILFCLIAAFAPAVFAQEKSEKADKKETKKADKKDAPKPIEIKANVLVTDEKGNFLNDVNESDIKIFEDGIEQKITYFAKKQGVLNVGLTMDNTGSIRPKLEDVIFAGKVLVDNLRENDEAFVVRFVDSNNVKLIENWTSNKTALKDAIEELYVEGGQSAVLDAIYLSTERILEREKTDKSRRYAILLFSDAENLRSFYKLNEVLKLFQGTDIQIFIISFAESTAKQKEKAIKLSHQLSLETGGTLYLLQKKYTKDELIAVLKALTVELRSNYIIGYTSTNQKRDGLPRKLTVSVSDSEKGEKRLGYIREGFVILKD